MFRIAYILGRRADLLVFIALPFIALAAGMASQKWLPVTAVAAVGLWMTTPHHFASWLRTFGFADEFHRWRFKLILGPIVIFSLVCLGLQWSPLTIAMLVMLWDHQHSLMQQYGFSRIYDFKAGTGSPSTARFDYLFTWIVYGNMFLVSPYWTEIWALELYQWKVPLNATIIQTVHTVSWTVTLVFLFTYVGHIAWSISNGHRVNPMKYLFLGASYFMWYFIAWYSSSALLYMVAHRIMHGLQYDVIVYSYIHRKAAKTDGVRKIMSLLARPQNILLLLAFAALYTVVFALLIGHNLTDFGLGLIHYDLPYDSLRELGIYNYVDASGYQLFAVTLINAVGLVHYYYDSFIWKVRDTKVQTGL